MVQNHCQTGRGSHVRGLLHLSCSALEGFAGGGVLAQSGKNAMSAGQSSQIGWKRGNFDTWKIPSACMYCVCREGIPTGAAGESLEGQQDLTEAQVKAAFSAWKCIRIKIVICSVGSSAALKLS